MRRQSRKATFPRAPEPFFPAANEQASTHPSLVGLSSFPSFFPPTLDWEAGTHFSGAHQYVSRARGALPFVRVLQPVANARRFGIPPSPLSALRHTSPPLLDFRRTTLVRAWDALLNVLRYCRPAMRPSPDGAMPMAGLARAVAYACPSFVFVSSFLFLPCFFFPFPWFICLPFPCLREL